MQLESFRNAPNSGFSFVNCKRNASLIRSGFQPPRTVETGTTIAGVVFKYGVVLGADTRATEGKLVSDKNCCKIHYLAKNIYCCGSGTAADTIFLTRTIASHLKLHCLNTNREARVDCACMLLKRTLFRFKSSVNAALVVGGVDKTGSYVYSIYPHGSSDKLPYSTMGSGCLAAMSVFEARWQQGLEEEDAKKLVCDAIAAGMFNDCGSGSNIDLCIIRKDSVDNLRNLEIHHKRTKCHLDYSLKLGTTKVLSTLVNNFDISEEVYTISKKTF